MGILDGKNFENRSVPLIKLEVDVVTKVEFDAFKSTLTNDLTALTLRVVALEDDHPSLMAHLLEPISTAHSGYIDIDNQIPDNSISVGKVSFTVLTLGTGHNQAAYGDHNHDGVYAPIGDLTNYVTLDTDQTITGVKTFTDSVFVNSQNFSTQDMVIDLNRGYDTAGGSFMSGLSIYNPFPAPGLPAGGNAMFLYDSADKRFKTYRGNPGTDAATFAYLSDVASAGGVKYSEEITAPGIGNYVTINPSPAISNGEMLLTVKRGYSLQAWDDPTSHVNNIGEVYYIKKSDSEYRVYSSGLSGAANIICAII